MADPQLVYSLAWALRIEGPAGVYAASTDLPEPAAVAALGRFYTKRLIKVDVAITRALPNLFYGTSELSETDFVLDNADGAIDQAEDWRYAPVVLYRYDRETHAVSIRLLARILRAQFPAGRAIFTVGDDSYWVSRTMLPATLIDPREGSPFETSSSPNVPVPVIFGEGVPVRAPNLVSDPAGDPGGYDFAVGHGGLYVRQLFQDLDTLTPGLERLGEFATAPGTPTLVSATRFSVTDDQRARYLIEGTEAGQHIRFKTTAGGSEYLYSVVTAYDATTTPHQVEIADPLLGSGLQSVQISGDYLVVRGYRDIIDGLLPAPAAPGVDITAVRLFDPGDGSLITVADNPLFPRATTHIADVIKEIITNRSWGFSSRTTQTVNADSFALANVTLALAGLVGAVNGGLGHDQQQRRGDAVLDELCIMRGIRLFRDDVGDWNIRVDHQPAAVSKFFQLGPGVESGIRIKRITEHSRAHVREAVRNVIVYWQPLGQANQGLNRYTARAFARHTTKAVGSLGVDREYYNPWIRDAATAEKVAHYIGEKLRGADERLSFVAGQEARDVELGEAVTVTAVPEGISGDWQVFGITETLTDYVFDCFRANDAAYGEPTDVVTSDAPSDIERRTASGSGSNLIINPSFNGPWATILGTTLPHNWAGVGGAGSVTRVNYSAAVAAETLGGNYLRITTTADETPDVDALRTLQVIKPSPCPGSELLLASIYCDQAEGLFLWVIFTGDGITKKLVPIIRDPSDINPAGWWRFYGRLRSPAGTTMIYPCWAFSKAGTYQVEATQLEVANRTARKPSTWKQHRPPDLRQTAATELTFNGATTYTAPNLIPAGVHVLGVSSRVTQDITLGTATGYDIGTLNDGTAWGEKLAVIDDDADTGPEHFKGGTSTVLYPTPTSVIVAGRTADGSAGTITGGKLRLTVTYERTAPAARA